MSRGTLRETTENGATLSNSREAGQSSWQAAPSSGGNDDEPSRITAGILEPLRCPFLTSDQDIYPDPDVYDASFYQNVDALDPELFYLGGLDLDFGDVNVQAQVFRNSTALQNWEGGDELVSNHRHTVLAATTSQAAAVVPAAVSTASLYFPGPHNTHQNIQTHHTMYDFDDGSAQYQYPGPAFTRQNAIHRPEEHGFQPTPVMRASSTHIPMPEAIFAPEAATPPGAIPEATSPPRAIPEAAPPPRAIRIANPPREAAAPGGLKCKWPNCRHKAPFSKRHNLLQHRRKVHGETIPVKRFRFGTPPPDDPTRVMQRHGRRR